MVYVYVCKRFKVTMELVSGKDSEWILNLVRFYLKHRRKEMQKLERAEVNPKKRVNTCSYDSSSDVFKINLVYKDQKGVDQELKWIIKVTRSDVNETANLLLRHEKQVFSRLVADLVNAIKQKSATFLDGARINYRDLILVPEYIYDETTHAASVTRNVLVLDNLEEKAYFGSLGPMNLSHFRCAVKTMAKFHAVGLCHKMIMWQAFLQQSNQEQAKRSFEDVEVEGENKVLIGKEGLFARFPFLAEKFQTMEHLISNRKTFLDMYEQVLQLCPKESHLVDLFQYIRMSTDDILGLTQDPDRPPEEEHPLDSISIGILETRSFLFIYEEDDNKENDNAAKNKVQRSHSDRATTRKAYNANKILKSAAGDGSQNKDGVPPGAKCPKLETGSPAKHSPPVKNNCFPGAARGGLSKNPFVRKKASQDDAVVPPLQLKRKEGPRDPHAKPVRAALVNAKYVTYGRITQDLAVLFFTSGNTTMRRFYLIKMVECFAETLGITLTNLGIDTDKFKLNWCNFVREFQTHILYGFLVGVLVGMANTSVADLNELIRQNAAAGGEKPVVLPEPTSTAGEDDINNRFIRLTTERINLLVDMMRDMAVYVESKDFEQGLPITNFARYHELWSMNNEDQEDYEESEYEDEDEEEDE